MPDLSSCVRCARPIPVDAPGGSCPPCLMALALGTPEDAADPTPLAPAAATVTAARPAPDAADQPTASYPPPGRTGWPAVPGYQILGALGAGGGGSVYRARQRVADREVAVKVLAEGADRARFDREVRALAALEHPHVVRVYEVGECAWGPFFSMELMPGGSLAARIRQAGPLPAAETAAVVERVARGVAAAHAAGTLHRDLKPGNVLLSADGTPKVADFGLAKDWVADADGTTATPSGAVLGTPAYMAPEMAAGRAAEVGPRTDVYGLGGVLYQALTGDPPYRGENLPVVLHQVLTEDPTPPRARNRRVPPELEAVCLRCLARQPQDRYESAAAVADDLARWRRGEPTIARPVPRVTRAARWAWRRRRGAAGVLAVVLGTLLVVAAAAMLLRRDPDAELKKIRRELRGSGPVVLVPEAGPPRWYRRDRGAADLTESDYRDGTCCFQAVEEAFLELLPAADVPPSFRLRAEVRHERGADFSAEVGLYFGLQARDPNAEEPLFAWQKVVFNDHPPVPPAGQKGPPSHLRYYVCLTKWPAGQRSTTYAPGMGMLEFAPPGQLGPWDWRTLEVEARPAGVRTWAWWPGQSRRELGPAAATAAEVRRSLADQYGSARPGRHAPDPPDGWPAAGSLGLYLRRAQAAFRNVIVERLPD